MIKTITGALRAIARTETLDELVALDGRLRTIAWNDGGEIRRAVEQRRSTLLAAEQAEDNRQRAAAASLRDRLLAFEVDASNEPDARRVIGAERQAIHAALERRNPDHLATVVAEANRVAQMWNALS
jgi:hypothetical protein